MAGTVEAVENFVVEDREIQGKTESDGMGGGKLSDGNVRSSLVSLE